MARITSEEIKKKFETHGDDEVQDIGLRGRVAIASFVEVLLRMWNWYQQKKSVWYQQQMIAVCDAQLSRLDPPDNQFAAVVTRLKSAILAFSDPASTEKALQGLIATNSDDAQIHKDLAGALSREQRRADALKEWEAAIALYRARHDLMGEGSAHLDVASFLLRTHKRNDFDRIADELSNAQRLFSELRDDVNLIRTNLLFGELYL
jgi:hypothetical protein